MGEEAPVIEVISRSDIHGAITFYLLLAGERLLLTLTPF
jgi:hypothetical protein